MIKKILLLAVLAASVTHCASVSTLQTGRVLEKGENSHSFGLSLYSSDDFIGGDDISGLPVFEYAYRRGMWDDIDVGIKIAIIGTAVLDMKYNLVNGEKFALATGAGLGYLSFTSTSNGQDQESTILDFIVPLYASYDLGEKFTVYGAAKYLLRTITADGVVDAEDGSLGVGSLGIQWGRKSGVFLEGTMMAGLDNDFSGTQLSGSYFFQF